MAARRHLRGQDGPATAGKMPALLFCMAQLQAPEHP